MIGLELCLELYAHPDVHQGKHQFEGGQCGVGLPVLLAYMVSPQVVPGIKLMLTLVSIRVGI